MKLSRLLLRVVLVETAEAVPSLCGPTDTHPDSALSPSQGPRYTQTLLSL